MDDRVKEGAFRSQDGTVLPAAIERGRRKGWLRREGSARRGFRYADAVGNRVTDPSQIERIQALRIPPAWTHVRICPSCGGRLQALGVDAAGRIQYLYHARFAARQQQIKYEKIERFGERLPALRQRMNDDISVEGFPKERVLAVILRLINDLHFRVGSEAGARRYKTFGITSLRNRHLEIRSGCELEFRYVGKHHIRHRRILVDEELAKLIKEIKALGGSRLFNYIDDEGIARPIAPRDVNGYIKAVMGAEFSAKDFRTWAGSVLAALVLAEMGPCDSERQLKRNCAAAARRVGEQLGNTAAVCRSCYIHPAVFERYRQGATIDQYRSKAERGIRRHQPEYEPEELALLKLLRTA